MSFVRNRFVPRGMRREISVLIAAGFALALMWRTAVSAAGFLIPSLQAPSAVRGINDRQPSPVVQLRAAPPDTTGVKEGLAVTSIRRYFEAWNVRDMDTATAQFSEDCEYEDTQYAGAFKGKDALKAHLFKVADALPPTFRFCIDDIADGGDVVGVQWHVENGGQALPFTRGCSMYRADPETGLLVYGFDVPEPAPVKPGSASLSLLSVASRIIAEPIRAIPLVVWILYVVIVFFSNGILPGPDATKFDGATWAEVRDLSLNFWLISPLLKLPFAPVLHPGLEAIFNLLLAWAAAFTGFMSDGRPGRPSGSMFPTLVGMQFLTNAIYLPYLVTRSPESSSAPKGSAGEGRMASQSSSEPGASPVYYEDLDPTEATISENRLLGPILFGVGVVAVLWGFYGRPEFGDFETRWVSLITLLSGDRLGTSFVVDLVLFACFQGWLVDDDLKRRQRGADRDADDFGWLAAIAKYVPFVGLCLYLLLRPALPTRPRSNESTGAATA